MAGRLYDTYGAALQHGTADVPDDAIRLGVARRPTPWFYAQVEENVPALAPPADLLAAVKDRHGDLLEEGLDDAAAHNAALDDHDYDERYLAHLDESDAARGAVEDVLDRLARGQDVALVCFENTDEKRCHRTLLRERIERSTDG